MEKELESMLGNKTGFHHTMEKIKMAQDKTLKKKKRIRVGKRGEEKIQAAEWVDEELRDNIKKRSKFSRRWRLARKRKEPEEDIKRFEREYKEQKIITAIMTGQKKGNWELYKIQEAKTNGKKFGS